MYSVFTEESLQPNVGDFGVLKKILQEPSRLDM